MRRNRVQRNAIRQLIEATGWLVLSDSDVRANKGERRGLVDSRRGHSDRQTQLPPFPAAFRPPNFRHSFIRTQSACGSAGMAGLSCSSPVICGTAALIRSRRSTFAPPTFQNDKNWADCSLAASGRRIARSGHWLCSLVEPLRPTRESSRALLDSSAQLCILVIA